MAASTRTDFLLDDTGDLLIENGDFAIGLSDEQHVSDIVSANKGDYRQFPTVGADLSKFLNKQDNNISQLKRDIQVNLEADGYRVKNFSIDSAGAMNLDYEPNY